MFIVPYFDLENPPSTEDAIVVTLICGTALLVTAWSIRHQLRAAWSRMVSAIPRDIRKAAPAAIGCAVAGALLAWGLLFLEAL